MKIANNESGIAHIGLIGLVLVVVAVGGFAYWRVSNANNQSAHTSDAEQVETLPTDLTSVKTLEEIEQIAGVTDSVTIIKFTLENENGMVIYKVTLSNGRKLTINGVTGQIISEETTDISDDDKIPAGLTITISPAEAYKLASTKSSSPIKSIELEVEDKKVVYKVEFKDGSKVEIDATNGTFIKAEVKDESEDGNDDSNDEEDRSDNEDDGNHDEDQNDNEDDGDKDENHDDGNHNEDDGGEDNIN